MMTPAKIKKKLGKLKHLASVHDDISLSTSPSPHLIVSNVGLDNAVPRQRIESVFAPHGAVDLRLGPRRSYGFVSFADAERAAAAREALQGTSFLHPATGREIVMVMGFVDCLPDLENEGDHAKSLPDGLMLLEDFISEDYEAALLRMLEETSEKWNEAEVGGRDDDNDPDDSNFLVYRV